MPPCVSLDFIQHWRALKIRFPISIVDLIQINVRLISRRISDGMSTDEFKGATSMRIYRQNPWIFDSHFGEFLREMNRTYSNGAVVALIRFSIVSTLLLLISLNPTQIHILRTKQDTIVSRHTLAHHWL